MTRLKRSYGESSTTCDRFDSPLDKHTPCESVRFDNIVKFLQRTTRLRKLVRRDGTTVNINSLRGKIVGLFVMSLTTWFNKHALIQCIQDIASAYNELSKSKKGQFEVVWIVEVDDLWKFDKYMKMMPWLAIPFTDYVTRNWLCSLAEIQGPDAYKIFLFNREGELFTQDADELFSSYGADAYPFTPARLREIEAEDYAIEGKKSLKNLLGNATRDFVVRNNRRQVSISQLENKVVGIYFCDTDYTLRSYFTQELLEIYWELKRRGKQFEVVMVPIGGSCFGKHHNADFKDIPWLSLPHEDRNCKRLVRIFDSEWEVENCLVIVGQRGSFVNMFGYSTINSYGIEAYPFSRLSVVEMEKKRLEESMKSLLREDKNSYVIRKSGEKMPIIHLCGKTILVLFAPFCCRGNVLVPNLIEWYAEIKKNHVDFEAILVTSGYDKSSFNEYFGQMPWFAFTHNDTRTRTMCSELCIGYPTLAVFGPNAQLLSMAAEKHFYAKGTKAYPFSGKDVLMDVYRLVAQRFMWPQEYDDRFAHN